MSTLLAFLPAAGHRLPNHPEHPGRVEAIGRLLESKGVLPDLMPLEAAAATEEQLQRVHSQHLIATVRSASAGGTGRLDADTYYTAYSYDAACLAAGAAAAAVDAILSGAASNGLALIRPPGHHAERDRAGGFCLFNNVAVATAQARAAGLERLLILDFDVHHGNGTQELFYADPAVLFVSLHLYYPFFYPGSGAAEESGIGAGKGATINIPFGPGAGDLAYAAAFERVIAPAARRLRPEMILISAGFDAHWSDPLAMAAMSLRGYAELVHAVISLAEELCAGRALFVLEGGYQLEALAFGVLNLAYALLGRDEIVDPLGPSAEPAADMGAILSYVQRLHLLP
ncbi:MAG: histone deacetylase family protein [Candidatus Promineifilaceae bacterium]